MKTDAAIFAMCDAATQAMDQTRATGKKVSDSDSSTLGPVIHITMGGFPDFDTILQVEIAAELVMSREL